MPQMAAPGAAVPGRGPGIRSLFAFFRYNAGNVFAGKFIYFLLLSIALLLVVTVIYVLNNELPPDAEAVYYILLVPSMLLVFYPSAYSVQSDIDARMIETLFGIPDYRYKVYLVRNLVQYTVVAGLLVVLALFCRLALAEFSIFSMVFHLMFPVVLISSVGFMVSTITRSGNGTAAVLVVILLIFWIAVEPLEGSKWNLFYNPFAPADALETILQAETTFFNRLYMAIGAVVATLFGLLRLQQREKFIQ